jgi:hypothetical protein
VIILGKRSPVNIRILFCGVLLLTSKMAVGACSFMDNRFTASDNINLNFGQIIVQRDTPSAAWLQPPVLPHSLTGTILSNAPPGSSPSGRQEAVIFSQYSIMLKLSISQAWRVLPSGL